MSEQNGVKRYCKYCKKPLVVNKNEHRQRLYCSDICRKKAARDEEIRQYGSEVEKSLMERIRSLEDHEDELNEQIGALNRQLEKSMVFEDRARLGEEMSRVFRDEVRQVCREIDFLLTNKVLIFNPQSPSYRQGMQLETWGKFVYAWARDNSDQESVYEMEKQYWRLEQKWTQTIHLCITAARKAGDEQSEYYSRELKRLQRERSAWREQYFKDHPQVKALKDLRYLITDIRDIEGQEPSPYDPRLEPLFREAFGYVLLELPREKPEWAHY